MHRKPMIRCASSLLLVSSVLLVACDVQPIGDPGAPLFDVGLLLEEVYPLNAAAGPFALWHVDDDVSLAPTALIAPPPPPPPPSLPPQPEPARLGVFDVVEVAAGGVARLDLFYGSISVDDDGTPRPAPSASEPLATTRSTIWYAPGGLDTATTSLPFDAAAFVASMPATTTEPIEVVALLDSPDRAARTCGDDVVATCSSDCDIVTGVGAAACCADAHAAFIACDAVVPVVGGGTFARLRWEASCCG